MLDLVPGLDRLVPGRPPRHLRRGLGPGSAARFLSSWARGATSLALHYPLEAVPPWRRSSSNGTGHPAPPDLHRPLPGDPSTLQRVQDGVGPLFHRRYWIDMVPDGTGPEQLAALVTDDVNAVAPTELGRFEHADGTAIGALHVGDEFLVRLPGPGRAPVRVVAIEPTGFTLATLDGHIEAGEIRFEVTHAADRATLRFQIESWARSSATLLHLLYDVVPLAQELQLVMWTRMCRNVADVIGAERASDVHVTTERLPWPLPAHPRPSEDAP